MPLLSLLGLPFRAIIVTPLKLSRLEVKCERGSGTEKAGGRTVDGLDDLDEGQVRAEQSRVKCPVRRGTAIKLFMAVWQLPSSQTRPSVRPSNYLSSCRKSRHQESCEGDENEAGGRYFPWHLSHSH